MKAQSSRTNYSSLLFLSLFAVSSVLTTTYASPNPVPEIVARADKQYILYPKKDAKEDDKKKFTETLQKDLGKTKVFESKVDCCSIGFWTASLNSDQVKNYKKKDVIKSILEDADETVGWGEEPTATSKQKRKETKQQNSRDEMKFISQPSDIPKLRDTPDYQYDDSAGKDVTIYIVNSGANFDHPVDFDLHSIIARSF
ncbi:MAG: hypothetical protein M1812_002031 [Candelaria pacifica]|nr:MAG: hypothetical protein M1812_002031 [Candelaria pacifica]